METLNAIVGVIAIISGGISALLWGSLKALRDSNSDLRARVDDLEDKNRLLAAEAVMAKADRDALARVVRGDDRLEEVVIKLDEHNRIAAEHWRAEEALLREVITRVGGAA